MMLLRTKLHGKTYEFPDIRLLMGKAKEEKSGDRLAGVAAEAISKEFRARRKRRWYIYKSPRTLLRNYPK
jgi:ethanolamine ammonia-lyase large subunit